MGGLLRDPICSIAPTRLPQSGPLTCLQATLCPDSSPPRQAPCIRPPAVAPASVLEYRYGHRGTHATWRVPAGEGFSVTSEAAMTFAALSRVSFHGSSSSRLAHRPATQDCRLRVFSASPTPVFSLLKAVFLSCPMSLVLIPQSMCPLCG